MSAIAATVLASTVFDADVASVFLKGHGKPILFSANEEKITSLALDLSSADIGLLAQGKRDYKAAFVPALREYFVLVLFCWEGSVTMAWI